MDRDDTQRPIIIKRKKIVVEDGHHGGAWKVAYADFVTAMMAFFMLMWLLNSTSETQRKGLADYFSPTLPIVRESAGGSGMLSGDSVQTESTYAQIGTGGSTQKNEGDFTPETLALKELEDRIIGRGGEALFSEQALRHVVTRVTDRGLVIEFFDTDDFSLFENEKITPFFTSMLRDLGKVSKIVINPVGVEAYVAATPVVIKDISPWNTSINRAKLVQDILRNSGVINDRLTRLTSHGSKAPTVDPVTAARNNRIEIVFLRFGR